MPLKRKWGKMLSKESQKVDFSFVTFACTARTRKRIRKYNDNNDITRRLVITLETIENSDKLKIKKKNN